MYEGELWLEIMLVDGINDDEQSILKFQELLKELKLDIPFSLKIARKLQKKGYQIKDTLDVEELEKQLCQLHAKV